MKNFASRVALGSLAMSAAVQSIAQTQTTPLPPPAVWDLEFQDSQCTITTVNKDVPGISVRVIPGQPETELYILHPPRPVSPGKDRKLTLILEPGEATLQANLSVLSRGDLLDLGVLDGAAVGEVEAQVIGRDERAGLGDVGAEHLP